MRYETVFDWAQVKLAEKWLNVLFKANPSKEHVVKNLANASGVNVTWNENGLVKLEGSWEHILRSQTIFENYLKSLEDSEAGIEKRDDFNLEKKSAMATSDFTSKCSNVAINQGTKSNEVYVNITLNAAKMSDFNNETIPVVNNVHHGVTASSSRSSGKMHRIPQVFGYEGNSFEHGFVVQSENNCVRQGVGSNQKMKESYNVSEYQHKVLLSICNPQPSHTDIKKTDNPETALLQTCCFGEDTNSNISRTLQSVEEVLSLETVSPSGIDTTVGFDKTKHSNTKSQSENTSVKCVSVELNDTSNSKHIKQKYHKKKDYEELAPYKFFCSMCSFKSKRASHFTRHMKLHNEVSKLFKCNQCSFTSIRLSHLRRHELNHSKLTLACNICQYQTNSQKLLVRHKRFKHSAPEVPEVKKDILQCQHCAYQTSRSHLLQRHTKVHESNALLIQEYHCKQCSYKTNRKEHFVRHTNNIHEGRRPFLCHWCGKAFKRQDALKQHSSTHTAQDAVTCPECGKGCRSHAHLSQHMTVHSTERLFLCELCGASFKTRAVQRKHMFTIHQHPKAFLCSHCSRKFSTKFALRRHVKQHSSQLPTEKPLQDQVPDPNTCVRLLAMDAVFYTDPAGTHTSTPNGIASPPKEKAKLLQSAATCEAESVNVIPTQTVMQSNSETTTLVYVTRTFVPLQR
ncbi:hypothetical protein R5R35_002230 [Gryllus longicercus]|uniref:C2H2-type domain-containing protein n=2 Tax=Gryllus longicercus TaxID=2509291 RepID=A0AAN9Z0D1_9ORTH